MIRYICKNCGVSFDEPARTEHANGSFIEETCPICLSADFAPANLCSCGNPKEVCSSLCAECQEDLRKRFAAFVDDLYPDELSALDEMLDGNSVSDMRSYF